MHHQKLFKKVIQIAVLGISFFLINCAQNGSDNDALLNSSDPEQRDPVTIRFYGASAGYNQQMVKEFEKATPDIRVEIVPVDYSKAEQIIKAGIASDDPVDVSFFWGSAMSTFVENDMALDLTGYLMENSQKWYNAFVQKFIDAGKFGKKWFAISYQPLIETTRCSCCYKEINLPESFKS